MDKLNLAQAHDLLLPGVRQWSRKYGIDIDLILDWPKGVLIARSPNASVVMLSEGEADWKKEYNARMMSLVTQSYAKYRETEERNFWGALWTN